MHKFITGFITLGLVLSSQSATALSPQVEISQVEVGQLKPSAETSNKMIELLTTWGLKITQCQNDVVRVKHDATGDVGCALPTEKLSANSFIYDSTNNVLKPLEISQTQGGTFPEVQTNPSPEQNSPTQINGETSSPGVEDFTFSFSNANQYSVCLDIILLAYEQRFSELENAPKNDCATKVINTFGTDISQELALKLIEKANLRATKQLTNALFPVYGVRRRVAINLGYTYKIDRDNPEIIKLIGS